MFLLVAPIIPICYWALWKPARAFQSGWRRRTLWLLAVLLVIYMMLAASGPEPFFSLLFIIYPILYGVLLRQIVRRCISPATFGRLRLFFVVFVLLWASELFAAIDSAIAHQDPLIRHMANYIGFYIGLALVVTWFLSRWRYTFPSLFSIGGLWGVLIEQQFLGIKILLNGDIATFLSFASVIFPVYGFYLAGPFLLFYEEWSVHPHTNRWQGLLLLLAVVVVPLLFWGLWFILLSLLGWDTTVLVV
jgi:hypothetical protein